MAAPAKGAARVRVREPIVPTRLLSDERLACLVAGGSERAFQAVYDRYHQQLYRFCYSLLRDRDDAYDALQSTLVRALAELRDGRRDAPLRPWLFRIAHNVAISELRRRARAGEQIETLASHAPSAEDRAGERARLTLLAEDLRELSERERGVLLMRELSGLSHQEIAVALGISIHAVRHAIYAARRSLGEFAEGRAMACKDVRRSISYGDARVLARARARAHLRECADCAAFASAIATRRADLQLLAPPLAPVLVAGLLASLRGTACAPGAGNGIAAGFAGKTVGALAAKTLVGVAIVASAGASIGRAAGSAEPHAGQRAALNVTTPHGRREPARRPARPARALGPHTGFAALAGLAAGGQPPGTPGGVQRVDSSAQPTGGSAAASSAPGTPAAGAGSVAVEAATLREATTHREAAPSEGGSQRRERSTNARHQRGLDRRSPTGAQHGRGPRATGEASPPARGPNTGSTAHARGPQPDELAAQSRGGQGGQPAAAGSRASVHDEHAPHGERREPGRATPAPEPLVSSAADDTVSLGDAARNGLHEPRSGPLGDSPSSPTVPAGAPAMAEVSGRDSSEPGV